jgi:hypothetical protein
MSDPRPEWLRPYAFVTGRIQSAPLDLAQRMESVYQRLQSEGWSVVVKSIGTDFSGPLGIPFPKEQPLELYLYRRETFWVWLFHDGARPANFDHLMTRSVRRTLSSGSGTAPSA